MPSPDPASAAPQAARPTLPSWSDTAGVTASVACAIHCALVPVVIGYLPAMGLSWVAGRGFHQGMTAFCFAAAVLAFVPGYKKHGKMAPALVGLLGVGLLAFEAFGFAGECALCVSPVASESITPSLAAWLPPVAGVLLIAAHLLNHRHTCRCCQSGHRHPH